MQDVNHVSTISISLTDFPHLVYLRLIYHQVRQPWFPDSWYSSVQRFKEENSAKIKKKASQLYSFNLLWFPFEILSFQKQIKSCEFLTYSISLNFTFQTSQVTVVCSSTYSHLCLTDIWYKRYDVYALMCFMMGYKYQYTCMKYIINSDIFQKHIYLFVKNNNTFYRKQTLPKAKMICAAIEMLERAFLLSIFCQIGSIYHFYWVQGGNFVKQLQKLRVQIGSPLL